LRHNGLSSGRFQGSQRRRHGPRLSSRSSHLAQAPPPAAPALRFDVVPDTLPNLKPRVVCGMTLIPAPPSADPKIALPEPTEKPKNPTTYTIRPLQPSICW